MDITSYLLGKKAGGGGGSGLDWSQLGYATTPKVITDGYNYGKSIKDNWDATVTSTKQMFKEDKNLVFFPSVDLSHVTEAESMFSGCYRLISVPSVIDLPNATTIKHMFYQDTNITEVNINTPQCTVFTCCFQGCTSLKKVGNIDLRNAEYLTSMFSGCNSLTTIGTIQGTTKDRSNLECDNMFASCKSLVTAPTFDLSKISSIKAMYSNCSSLVNVPVMNLSKIKEASQSTYNSSNLYAFSGCPSLSNDSLNNIMASVATATNVTKTIHKSLKALGFTEEQANICVTLSNWTALSNAGWTTGYES